MNYIPPDFEILNELLNRDQFQFGAAELQSLLCAQLTIVGQIGIEQWLSTAGGETFTMESLDPATMAALEELFLWTEEALRDPQMSFQLFLPDDDVSLAARSEALTQWCSGFLAGLGLSGIGESNDMPDDAREFLSDLADISCADFIIEASDESDEVAFVELVEYARVGTMLVYETLRGPDETELVH
jgi:uncharacterized protein YgfB (UPF0149 family)